MDATFRENETGSRQATPLTAASASTSPPPSASRPAKPYQAIVAPIPRLWPRALIYRARAPPLACPFAHASSRPLIGDHALCSKPFPHLSLSSKRRRKEGSSLCLPPAASRSPFFAAARKKNKRTVELQLCGSGTRLDVIMTCWACRSKLSCESFLIVRSTEECRAS